VTFGSPWRSARRAPLGLGRDLGHHFTRSGKMMANDTTVATIATRFSSGGATAQHCTKR